MDHRITVFLQISNTEDKVFGSKGIIPQARNHLYRWIFKFSKTKDISYLQDLCVNLFRANPFFSKVNNFLMAVNQKQLISSVQSLSHVQLFATPWTTERQASLFITNSWSLLKLMSIESVRPSSHLLLCCPLLLLPSIFPSIRDFSNESVLIRWPKYWSFSFSISPSNEHSGLISFGIDWLDLLEVQGTLKSLLQTTVQKHQFFVTQLCLYFKSHTHTWLLEKS